jgi:predicted secreted protein
MPQTLHHDSAIPGSRGCPIGYAISDVVTYPRQNDTVLVVLLSVFKVGFEGPDRRFLAVAYVAP